MRRVGGLRQRTDAWYESQEGWATTTPQAANDAQERAEYPLASKAGKAILAGADKRQEHEQITTVGRA
ncbi:MAG: hypothetical protein ACTH3D_07070 [Halomonas sp.]